MNKRLLFFAIPILLIASLGVAQPSHSDAGNYSNPTVNMCAKHHLSVGQVVPLGPSHSGVKFGVECADANFGGIITIR